MSLERGGLGIIMLLWAWSQLNWDHLWGGHAQVIQVIHVCSGRSGVNMGMP